MNRLYLLLLLFLGIFSYGCDRLDEDVAPNAELQNEERLRYIYASPSGPSVFKVESLYTSTLPFSIQITAAPRKGELQMNPHGFLLYKPYRSFTNGSDRIGYTVLQNGTRVASDSLMIVMPEAKEAYPCTAGAMSDSISVMVNSSEQELDVLANDIFCSGTSLTLRIEVAPAHGQLSLNNNLFYYTPSSGYEGQDYFIYQLCQEQNLTDGTPANCSYAYVQLQINELQGENCSFASQPDNYVLSADTTAGSTGYFEFAILANDALCGKALTSLTASAPQQGLAYISGQLLYYQPKNGFIGTDQLQYRICDEDGNCSESLVSIVCE